MYVKLDGMTTVCGEITQTTDVRPNVTVSCSSTNRPVDSIRLIRQNAAGNDARHLVLCEVLIFGFLYRSKLQADYYLHPFHADNMILLEKSEYIMNEFD